MRVLVTGSGGNVGREVVRALKDRGLAFRRGERRTEPGDPDSVKFDFLDRATWAPAARGCDALFLLRPPAIANTKETLNPFIDVARAEGVGHVVFLSVEGAGDNSIVPHHAVEKHLEKAGRYTLLRPGFFAQNLQDAYRRDIVEDARIYVPAGRGRVAWIDLADVADVAARVFSEPERHDGQAYTLTGPEAIDVAEAARIVSDTLGRPIRYVPAAIPGYALHLRRRGLPWMQILVQTILHVGLRSGGAERVSPEAERLLGRRPNTLAEYVRREARTWRA